MKKDVVHIESCFIRLRQLFVFVSFFAFALLFPLKGHIWIWKIAFALFTVSVLTASFSLHYLFSDEKLEIWLMRCRLFAKPFKAFDYWPPSTDYPPVSQTQKFEANAYFYDSPPKGIKLKVIPIANLKEIQYIEKKWTGLILLSISNQTDCASRKRLKSLLPSRKKLTLFVDKESGMTAKNVHAIMKMSQGTTT